MITELLPIGRDSPLTGRELCRMTGIRQREITKLIQRERLFGSPIAASCRDSQGYFIARNKAELDDYCLRLRHRIREMTLTLISLERAARNLEIENEAAEKRQEGGDTRE